MTCNAKWLLVILRVTLSESFVWIMQNGRHYTQKKTTHCTFLLFEGFPFTRDIIPSSSYISFSFGKLSLWNSIISLTKELLSVIQSSLTHLAHKHINLPPQTVEGPSIKSVNSQNSQTLTAYLTEQMALGTSTLWR